MNAPVATIRCQTCSTFLQIPPGGKRLCGCGSWVAAPPAQGSALVVPTSYLPWPFLLLVVGLVLGGVAIALATMDQGGAMYTSLVVGLVLFVVVVTFVVIRESHKPLEEEVEDEGLPSMASLAIAGERVPEPEMSPSVQGLRAALEAEQRSSAPSADLPRNLTPPFDAYQGHEPFLFASYSHQDAELVYSEIERLHHLGYRVWYDEGICPGQEWPEAVALALAQAAFFLVFVSPRALASNNVRNEINLALKKKKPFLAIHLEKTELPGGVELQIGSLQAILKYEVDEDRFRRRLAVSLPAELRAV